LEALESTARPFPKLLSVGWLALCRHSARLLNVSGHPLHRYVPL
jgi:hypothetical protein